MSSKTLIIAEVGSVHDGSFGNAMKLIDLAADCGADVIKFQHHIASAETLPDAPPPHFFTAEPRYSYFERTAFSTAQWEKLKDHCGERNVEFLCSPFSVQSVDALERIGVRRYKVPSGEITNIPFLEAIANTGKPVLLSSGMSSWSELDAAVNTVVRKHNRLTVMQCTSEYPCPPEHVGLNILVEMKERYRLPVGLSDHTLNNYAAFAAVTLGASVIEKHLTFSRQMYGSDARHSLEPAEFADAVQGIRAIEAMLSAHVDKNDLQRFETMKKTFEKSVVSVIDIPKGAVISEDMLGIMKPGTGISAARYGEIVGRRAARNIQAKQLLREEDLEAI